MVTKHYFNHQHCTSSEGIINIILLISISINVVSVVLGNCLNAGTNSQISSNQVPGSSVMWQGHLVGLVTPHWFTRPGLTKCQVIDPCNAKETQVGAISSAGLIRGLSWIVTWIGAPTMVCLNQAKGVAYIGCLSTNTKERLEHWIKAMHPRGVE
jgi:hypothetical protein